MQVYPFLFFRAGQFLYIGKAIDTSIHDHHAIQLAISFDKPIEFILPHSTLQLKAAIIDSDQPHECRTYGNTFVLLNIAPESRIGIALKEKFLSEKKFSELPGADASLFISILKEELESENTDSNKIFSIARQFIFTITDIEETKIIDERISEVLKLLDQPSENRVKIDDLAGKVFISPYRLIHLFTEQVGIPIRKYILWTKLLVGVQKIAETKNITRAALEAGFSDAPHFNRTFKRMFGLNPSRLLKNSQIIQVYGK